MNYKFIPRFYYTLSLFSFLANSRKESLGVFKNRINFNTARTGLRLLLSSISSNQLKVGVQSYTCHTVFQAIKNSGHTPVFIDITNDFQLCLVDLEAKINDIDVLIITHTFGFPERITKIKEIAQNVIILEDCAHSFLSKSKGVLTGTLADASIFSTGLAKFPAIGAGGFCLVNNKEMFPYFDEEYKKLSSSSFLASSISFIKTVLFSVLMKAPFYGLFTYPIGKKLDTKVDFVDKFTFNEGLSFNWVKRVFNSNEKRFFIQVESQKSNAQLLLSLLNSSIGTIRVDGNVEPNYYTFPILVKKRDLLFQELLKNNIEPGKHFSKSLLWAKEFGYQPGDCPKTEEIINQVITLPIHNGVTSKVIRKMAEIINKYE